MRRSALFLLTLHLAAGSALAQLTPVAPPLPSTQPPVSNGGLSGHLAAATPAHPAANQPLVAPVREILTNFDPQRVEVTWALNHWQLAVDGQVLKDFGRREVEARVAMRLVRDLHLTQHGVVGSPTPVMEYWLSNGRAPHGMPTGLHLMPLDPQELRVAQMQGQWCVRDSSRVLFNFGGQETDARNAVAIIHKYGFTQVGVIGGAGPSMLVMLGHGDALNGDEPAAQHLIHHSPLHDAAANDPHAAAIQQAKFSSSDTNPIATPVIPPLRPATETHKQSVNQFGRTETVDVLPVNNDATKLRRSAPPPPLATLWIDRTPFDWRQFQLRQEGTQHVIVAGNFVLARFTNDRDARLAMAALQHYRFTEVDRIGRPQAFCSYFLANGEAPRGQYLGVRSEPLVPEKLSVAMIDNRWAIVVDGKQPLFWFGTQHEEAATMLDVIQRYKFDRLCHIGDERGLTFFVCSH